VHGSSHQLQLVVILTPPLPNPSPARGEGLLAVASLVGTGLTWTARHGLNFGSG